MFGGHIHEVKTHNDNCVSSHRDCIFYACDHLQHRPSCSSHHASGAAEGPDGTRLRAVHVSASHPSGLRLDVQTTFVSCIGRGDGFMQIQQCQENTHPESCDSLSQFRTMNDSLDPFCVSLSLWETMISYVYVCVCVFKKRGIKKKDASAFNKTFLKDCNE